MATPTNYSACVRIPVLNFSRDKIFVVNVQSAKTANIFNLENFRLYGNIMRMCKCKSHSNELSRATQMTSPKGGAHVRTRCEGRNYTL